MIEILAPAGDIKSFEAAINQGANAVYLGLNNFNARMKADNFNIDNINEYIKKAHFFGVKVYITINTIIQNNEFNELISLVKVAVNAKADAFLVQDLGVVEVLKEAFPGIVLHASTQLGVHNLYGAKMAEKLGFKRVVLSRETKLEDIKLIKKNTNLEIEYFVQGALCIAFSGNCYMSSIEQGASGNRGLCKQLCRLPYSATLGDDKFSGYLLSAKDLSLANNLKELIDAGVTSLKIEGRMRRPGYVASAVKVYRELVDKIELEGNAKLNKRQEIELKTAFSRGTYLQKAYLEEGTPFVVDNIHGNHIGIEIGYVKEVKPFKEDLFKVDIFSNKEINDGDGLKFFEGNIEKASLGVGDCKKISQSLYSFITKTKLKPGYKVNLILDNNQENELLSVARKLPINIKVEAMIGKPLLIYAEYQNILVSKKSDYILEAAINAPLSKEDIEKQVSKVGDNGFVAEKISINTNGVFVAKSLLNSIRREVIEELKEKIIEINEEIDINCKDFIEVQDCITKNEFSTQVINEDIEIIKDANYYVLAPETYSISRVNELLRLIGENINKAILKLPIIANNKDLEIIDNILKTTKINKVLSENIYGLWYLQKGLTVFVGAGHNVANKYAAKMLKDLDVCAISKSIEYKDANCGDVDLININNEIPIMTFAHCPYKTLFNNECNKCTYKKGLTLKQNGREYSVRRVRLSQCYFELIK